VPGKEIWFSRVAMRKLTLTGTPTAVKFCRLDKVTGVFTKRTKVK